MMFREYMSVSARNASSGAAISLNSIPWKLPIGKCIINAFTISIDRKQFGENFCKQWYMIV